MRPGTVKAEGFLIEAREVPHKGGRTFGYRISDGRSVLTYVPDHCPTATGPGPDGWGEYHPAVLELAAGADLLIHDAQYVDEDMPQKRGWGHSLVDDALALARSQWTRARSKAVSAPARSTRSGW